MSDELTGAPAAPTGEGTPAPQQPATPAPASVQAAPQQSAQQPAQQQAALPNHDPTAEPSWLKERLSRAATSAQAKLLRELGFDKADDIKGRLAKAKELEDAQLSDQERTANKIKELTTAAESATKYSTVAAEAVKELFEALPEAHRVAIDELDPQTPEDRLKFIRAFRKLGGSTTPTTSAAPATGQPVAAAPAAPPPLAAPITTAPTNGAPRPTTPRSKWDEYSDLEQTNPRAAGLFYSLNQRAVEASRPASQ